MSSKLHEKKITSFRDLRAWQASHELAGIVYKLTSKFPEDEKFNLSSQLKRSSVSIASNIAEGFARKSAKDKRKFYQIALGSLNELQSQLGLANDVLAINIPSFSQLDNLIIRTHKLINGLIKSAMDWHEPKT
jgi:four helix bundle protein